LFHVINHLMRIQISAHDNAPSQSTPKYTKPAGRLPIDSGSVGTNPETGSQRSINGRPRDRRQVLNDPANNGTLLVSTTMALHVG